MKIVINARLLIKNRLDGIGWFSYETLSRITREHPDHEFIFLFDRPWSDEFIFSSNITPVVLRPAARHPFLWVFWFQISVPLFLKREKPDLFFSPDGYIPLYTRTPCLPIIHDINFFHRPKDLPLLTRWYHNFFFPRFANKALNIGTVSEFSKNDICTSYGIERGKVTVIYNGVNELYKPLGKTERDEVIKSLTGGCPYFIFIGNFLPRKNIPNMLRAFDLFRGRYRQEYKLVLVGERHFLSGNLDKVLNLMRYKNDVIFTGRKEPLYLHRLLASASALVFVPFIEGFGIPLIEAMRCGVPVITSNTTSLTEIAGNAALFSGPEDVQGICENMQKVAFDSSTSAMLIKNGLKRADLFSWEKSALYSWQLIEKTIADA